jgi:hypothetical protein
LRRWRWLRTWRFDGRCFDDRLGDRDGFRLRLWLRLRDRFRLDDEVGLRWERRRRRCHGLTAGGGAAGGPLGGGAGSFFGCAFGLV